MNSIKLLRDTRSCWWNLDKLRPQMLPWQLCDKNLEKTFETTRHRISRNASSDISNLNYFSISRLKYVFCVFLLRYCYNLIENVTQNAEFFFENPVFALLLELLPPCYEFVVTRVYSKFGRGWILWKFSEFIRRRAKTIYSESFKSLQFEPSSAHSIPIWNGKMWTI